MNELESAEKLRDSIVTYAADCDERWLLSLVDEIEREVAERYMLLPVDADGVPIRIGDLLECSEYGNQTERFTVYGYTTEYSTWTGDTATLMATNENSTEFYCDRCHHVKPRTIEDVLREFASEYHNAASSPNTFDSDGMIGRCAAELRGMMEADDD